MSTSLSWILILSMVCKSYSTDLCGENQCLPLDYDQNQQPDDLNTIFLSLGNPAATLFSITNVDDSKFTLSCTASFYVIWEDSRLTLDNFTDREMAYVGTWLKDKIWKPDPN